MDFDDTPDEARFRAAARAWLEQNAQPRASSVSDLMGDDQESVEEVVAASRAWQARKFDAGYAAITWPEAYGGRNGTPIQQVIYNQEEARFAARGSIFAIGLGNCIPAIRQWGDAAQRERYLRAALRGEEIWCQLFSEPAAGSDLAGVRTRAVRDGDEWVVHGQKTWTSGAHYCDFGLLLARTDPKARKHEGLSMFIMDMRAPGVSVRPVRQLSGHAEFNDVFLEGVRIPDENRLGPENGGWRVAVTTLLFERNSVSSGLGFVDHRFILDLARRSTLGDRPAIADDRIRERIANLYVRSRALTLLGYRAQTALSKGETPGPEQSVTKAVAAPQGQAASYLAMDLMGPAGILTPRDLGPAWRQVEWSWTWGAAMRIAGGSDEILRNIIAERVLGLPADSRIDKDTPFDQLPA